MSNGYKSLLDDRIKRVRIDLNRDIERQNGFNTDLRTKLELLHEQSIKITEDLDRLNDKLEQLSGLLSVQADCLMEHNKDAMVELAALKERNRAFEMNLGDCKSIVLAVVFGWIGIRWMIGEDDVLSRWQRALEAALV